MLSGCHVTRAQWGRNTKQRADKAQDWDSTQGWWRDMLGKGLGEDVKIKKRNKRQTLPKEALPLIVAN